MANYKRNAEKAMKNMSAICEIRQLRAKRAYEDQKTKLHYAQAHLNSKASELAQVENEAQKLRDAVLQPPIEHHIRIQQSIHDKRRWLKYDLEKAQYFYDDANSDVHIENKETERCRKDWLKLQNKQHCYVEKLKQLHRQSVASAEVSEESELADNLTANAVLRAD